MTGTSGFIGSHVVDQALAAGYKVRATSRSAETDAWLVDHFNKKWGSGSVDIVEVEDMEAEGAFNDVVKGTYGPLQDAALKYMSLTDILKVPLASFIWHMT